MSWQEQPVTDAEAEVWRMRFDPESLLTYREIVAITGHGGATVMISIALRKLQDRSPDHPASPEEQELIDLALAVGAPDLKTAYEMRNLQVRQHRQRLWHEEFHRSRR